MNIKTPFLMTVLLCAAVWPVRAGAQSAPQTASQFPAPAAAGAIVSNSPACTPVREAILSLNRPLFGHPAVWEAVLGDAKGMVEFSGAVMLDNKNILAAADITDRTGKPVDYMLVELNHRGRALDEKRYPAKSGERSAGIARTGDGFVVISTIADGKDGSAHAVRLAWYDAARDFKHEQIIRDAAFDYRAISVSPAVDGLGVVAVMRATNRRTGAEDHSILYRLDKAGKTVWRRAYQPGAANLLYGVNVVDGAHYIAGGQIRHEDGRLAGWLMKLGDDGTIVWQNIYPRGQMAVFRAGGPKPMADGPDRYVVAGQIVPHGSAPAATWLMEVDAAGSMVWQRYLRVPGYDMDGRGVLAHADSRITLLSNVTRGKSRPMDDDEFALAPDHIRLTTLSPRGILLLDEPYLEGHAATARQLARGWNDERIVTASVELNVTARHEERVELITDALRRRQQESTAGEGETQDADDQTAAAPAPQDAEVQSAPADIRSEGWIFVATPPEFYDDPCLLPISSLSP